MRIHFVWKRWRTSLTPFFRARLEYYTSSDARGNVRAQHPTCYVLGIGRLELHKHIM